MGKKNKSSSNHIQCIIPLCTAGLNNTHIGHRRGRTHPRLLLQISVIFSHCSQVTHSAPEITTRKEKKKNPPLASLLNVPFICGRLIHHYRIRALSYSRASLHFPPSESAPRLDLTEGNYGICCCFTNWFPAASICPDLSPRGSEVRACF